MSRSSWTLAIDIGSTSTKAAVATPHGALRTIELEDTTAEMPSGVLLDAGGHLLVGAAARQAALATPDRFEPMPRRRLLEAGVQLGEADLAPTDLLAAIIRRVRVRADDLLGHEPEHLVLTHPASWGRHRQRALSAAATAAGADPARLALLPEPVAAALHHAGQPDPSGPADPILVFDLGAMSCDTTLLLPSSDDVEPWTPVATTTQDLQGGELFDHRLRCWAVEELRAAGHTGVAERLDRRHDPLSEQLHEQLRAAKHSLSEFASATVTITVEDAHIELVLAEEELEALIRPDIVAAARSVVRLLDDAHVSPGSLGGFYLSGGSSFLRLVHRELREHTGRLPDPFDEPLHATVLGAASSTWSPSRPEAGRRTEVGASGWDDLADALVAYLRREGATALDHTSRLRSWLSDLHPDRPLAAHLLVTALRDGLVTELRAGDRDAALIAALAERLSQDNAIAYEHSEPAINAWSDALTRVGL